MHTFDPPSRPYRSDVSMLTLNLCRLYTLIIYLTHSTDLQNCQEHRRISKCRSPFSCPVTLAIKPLGRELDWDIWHLRSPLWHAWAEQCQEARPYNSLEDQSWLLPIHTGPGKRKLFTHDSMKTECQYLHTLVDCVWEICFWCSDNMSPIDPVWNIEWSERNDRSSCDAIHGCINWVTLYSRPYTMICKLIYTMDT